jgi:alcohol dehydrogenase YqhD (iron-dependent ADH family)
MTHSFTYHMPTKVVFGNGAVNGLGKEAEALHARRVLIVTGRGSMRKTGAL